MKPECYTPVEHFTPPKECKGCRWFSGNDCWRDVPGADLIFTAEDESVYLTNFPETCERRDGKKAKAKK